jgi:hypothetical protein
MNIKKMLNFVLTCGDCCVEVISCCLERRKFTLAVEDYLEPEVGVAVAVTAALTSPKVRGLLRRGAVYGLAGVLTAGDAISSLARGVKRGAQKATANAALHNGAAEAAEHTIQPASKYVEPSSVVPQGAGEAAPEAAEQTPKRSRKPAEAANE